MVTERDAVLGTWRATDVSDPPSCCNGLDRSDGLPALLIVSFARRKAAGIASDHKRQFLWTSAAPVN